jgi:ribosome recycling factor
MDHLKKSEKDGELTEDEHHHMHDQVQKITDEYGKKIDTMVITKEKEILQ